MKRSFSILQVWLSLWLFFAAHTLLYASNDPEWIAATSPTGDDLSKVVFGTGQFVALAPGDGGDSRIFYSADGAIWEEAQLPPGLALVDVVYGGDRFFAVGEIADEVVGVKSTDAIAWETVESFLPFESVPASAAYAVGHFWVIPETGDLHASPDLEDWTAVGRGGIQTHLAEHDGAVIGAVIALRENGVARFNWTEEEALELDSPESLLATAALSFVSGPDRVVVLSADGDSRSTAVSGDGRVWVSFEYGVADLNVLARVEDRFLALGNGIVLSSVDGARWADRSAGVGDAVLQSGAAGNGKIVAVGDAGTILWREAAFAPAILTQPPEETVVPEGQPLVLAVEVEEADDVSVSWKQDGAEVNGVTSPVFRVGAVSSDDAGTYTAVITDESGKSVESSPANVLVTESLEEPVAWEEIASFEGPLSRLATGGRGTLAFGHNGTFRESLEGYLRGSVHGAWSRDGVHWRTATLPSLTPRMAAGEVRDLLWIGGYRGFAFSEDGIAWGKVEVDGSPTTLVGEHEGELFANSGSALWTSENGEEWVKSDALSFFSLVGGYYSSGESLILAAKSGILEWDGSTWRILASASGEGYQPRLVANDETILFVDRTHPSLAVSHDREYFTQLAAANMRDVILSGETYFRVGYEGAQSSRDGIWWADRSQGLGNVVLNGVKKVDDFLIAVGNDGRIFRRPAALEPAFYQHPRSVTAVVGQPVKLTARMDGEAEIQWRRDGDPIEGAVGPTLEIPEVTAEDAGSYTAVATNAVGSVASNEGLLTVEDEPLANPWMEIGRIPVLEPYGGANPDVFVTGNGMSVGRVPHYGGMFVATEDGKSWVRGIIPNEGRRIFFAGDFFFASRYHPDDPTMISEDGLTWQASTLPEITAIAHSGGVYVAATEDGLHWSEDLDTWTLGVAVEDVEHIVYGGDRFVAIGGEPLRSWVSEDGKGWSVNDLTASDLTPTPVDIAFGNDTFVLAGERNRNGFFNYFLNTSPDGETWSGWNQVDRVEQLVFIAGNFWAYGEGLRSSSDGENWVERELSNFWSNYQRLVFADSNDVIFQSHDKVYRRSGLLEPIFHEAAPGDAAVAPGDAVQFNAPAAHGTGDFVYRWRRNDELLPETSGPVLRIEEMEAVDGGIYTVEVSNASGGESVDFRVYFLGIYSDWADHFGEKDEPMLPDADPGGRGISNLARYALDLDPVAPDRAELPRANIEEVDGERFPALGFQVLAGAEDFSWRVETSVDLEQWRPLDDSVVEAGDSEGGRREMLVRDPRPLDEGEANRFLRLRLELLE